MTSEECIKIIVGRLISLVDGGQLNATYNQSEDTISFYVNDISIGERPLLTLRVSDHRPEYQKYIRPDLTPPSSGVDTNVSIEFYKPKYNEKGKRIDNKVNPGVSIQHSESVVVHFIINSYSYTPKLLELTDVDTIYNAVIKWINGGIGVQYEDPFKGTPKAAIPQSKEAVLKNNNQKNINDNRNMNKKLIRLTESDLHRIVKESVNKVLNEIGDTERGQYALGALQGRAYTRMKKAKENGNIDDLKKHMRTFDDAIETALKHNYVGDINDADYQNRVALANAEHKGYLDYMKKQ